MHSQIFYVEFQHNNTKHCIATVLYVETKTCQPFKSIYINLSKEKKHLIIRLQNKVSDHLILSNYKTCLEFNNPPIVPMKKHLSIFYILTWFPSINSRKKNFTLWTFFANTLRLKTINQKDKKLGKTVKNDLWKILNLKKEFLKTNHHIWKAIVVVSII